MKYLILITSIIIGSLNLSFAAISYGTAPELAPPVEKNVKKKKPHIKKRLFKKKRKPNKTDSKGKVTWLIIAGIICAITALIFTLIAIWTYVSTGFIFGWFLGVVVFFGALAITSFILASVYTKNVGVRGTQRGRNQGKATY